MELTLQEKLKLIKFFEFLLDEEISKPLGQMNSEAVDNYIKILLHLKDINIELSSEFISEQVRKIFHPEETAVPETAKTSKKHFNKRKIWLVAACITVLVALFSVISFSSERSVVDTLEEFFGTFEFIPFGKETDIGNETYGKGTTAKLYESVEDFVKTEKISLMLPNNLENTICRISLGKTDGKETIDISYVDSNLFITITLDSEIPKDTLAFCNNKTTFNGIDYYYCVMNDIHQAQAYFQYNGNFYTIAHADEEKLMKVLRNMEEVKHED